MPNSKSPKNRDIAGMAPRLIKGLRHYTEISSRVFVTTLTTVALFGVPGYFLDRALGTDPWIFLCMILLSLPASLFLVHRVMTRYVSRFINS